MIEVSTDAYEQVLTHAREGAPREVCGILGGERAESGRDGSDGSHAAEADQRNASRAVSVHRTANAARSPRRTYLIDPEEQLAIMEEIEDSGQEIIGFYHSHPTGPPRPSAVDETRATWIGYSYAICLPDLSFVGSWRWSGESFTPEVLALR